MPIVKVGKKKLLETLDCNHSYTDEEVEELCSNFGVELDDVTTEKAIIRKEKHLEDDHLSDDDEIIYKIEVPANRYDLLCLEGLSQGIRIFYGLENEIPTYKLAEVDEGSLLEMHVKPETAQIRPYVVCAVLRGITFDEARYKSFMDLQDQLHRNICRERTLVAIGAHDLDTVEGPFTYDALTPSEINFVPLKQTRSFGADEVMTLYQSDKTLKKFLHIIENSPVYPVIYDRNRNVLSLPPIINGARSAITLSTKNVLIECTTTDLVRANIVLNTMVTMFSRYCENKFEVEPVRIIYPDLTSYHPQGESRAMYSPDLSLIHMNVPLSYIMRTLAVEIPENEVADLMKKMQIRAEKCVLENGEVGFSVSIPPTRSDILHICDVAESVAIAHGFNNIHSCSKPASLNQSAYTAKLSLNKFSDLIRKETFAMAGFTEVLTFILGSRKENFTMINREDDAKTAVIISNPRSADCEVARAGLMASLLKTVAYQKDHPKPIKIFEVSDVVVLDETSDVGARNQRRAAALYCGATSNFDLMHSLLDRIMLGVNVTYESVCRLELSGEPEFLPGQQTNVVYKGNKIGKLGVVHPEVLRNFDISYPCSYLELNLESLL